MPKGLFVGGTGSHAGKTSAALGLIASLRGMGHEVQAAKAGPDFLDAAWLALATGRPAPNLDLFMGPEDGWRRCWHRFAGAPFAVVEGAMGLFDGDAAGTSSGAALAQALDYPILLLLNARSLGHSAAALAQGFLQYRPPEISGPLRFCGVVCTHVASARHWDLLSRALAPVCAAANVPLAGYLPVEGAPRLESRHLGLKQACECGLDTAAVGEWFRAHVDLDAILARCDVPEMAPLPAAPPTPGAGVTIAIARDEAFGFCYADLPLLLAELGAETVFFSPLRDHALPRCDGIYIPGGYPELYAEVLAANEPLRSALRQAASLPIYGECGGFMYLQERLADTSGRVWPMVGLLPGQTTVEQKLVALGYRKGVSPHLPTPVYGHEFHYARGQDGVSPFWRWTDAEGRQVAEGGNYRGSVVGSWVHLYPEGSRVFWESWLARAKTGMRGATYGK